MLSSGNAFALINKHSAHLLGWLGDELGDAQGDGTYTSTKNANDRPEMVKHFLAAFRQAEQSWDAAFLDANGNRADQAFGARDDRDRCERAGRFRKMS